MKVVLSRKGMDSEYGGIPSPIMKDEQDNWKFYSLPIPSSENSDIKYSELSMYDNFTVADFLKDIPLKSKMSEFCHLDPDIRKQYLKSRSKEWNPNFGQVKSAQSHLQNNNIGKGDIFLFFGWFQKAEYKNNKFTYIKDKNYPYGFHVIYGYLQIEEIYKPNIGNVPKWLDYHPHTKYKDKNEFNNPNNTIYVATDFKKNNSQVNKNGAGFFNFSDELILTKGEQNNRTLWKLPLEFHPDNDISLSYNKSINRWDKENNNANLKSASKGQEFIFKDSNKIVEKWCINLIEKFGKIII